MFADSAVLSFWNHRGSILAQSGSFSQWGFQHLSSPLPLLGSPSFILLSGTETRKPLCLPTSPSPLTFKNTTLALLSSTGVRKGDSSLITFLFLVFSCPDVFYLGLIAVFKIIKCQALRDSQSLPLCFVSEETEAEDLVWASESYLSSSSQVEVAPVTQWCPTLCDAMDYSLSGFSVHGILQARTLE